MIAYSHTLYIVDPVGLADLVHSLHPVNRFQADFGLEFRAVRIPRSLLAHLMSSQLNGSATA